MKAAGVKRLFLNGKPVSVIKDFRANEKVAA